MIVRLEEDKTGIIPEIDSDKLEKFVSPSWLAINIDIKDDLVTAQEKGKKLILSLESNFEIDKKYIRIYYNGSNGFFFKLPAVLFGGFKDSYKLASQQKFAFQQLTAGFDKFDDSIYTATRSITKPNIMDIQSELYVIPLTYSEFFSWSSDKILEAAKVSREIEYFPEEEMEIIPALQELITKATEEKPAYSSTKYAGNKNNQIFDFIRENVGVPEVAEKLGLVLHKQGDKLQGNCPTNHASSRERCFTVNEEYFHCFSCKTHGDATKLVEIVKNLSPIEAANWILVNFDLEQKFRQKNLNYKPLSPEEIEKVEKNKINSMLYEEAFKWMKEKLPENKAAMDYLTKERKYNEEDVLKSEWCSFPKEKEIRDYLISNFPDKVKEIKDLPLHGQKVDFSTLAFPYRDRRGNIRGFLKRATTPKGVMIEGKEQRWDSTFGLSKKDIFNLSKCNKTDKLLIVEGYPDALIFTAMGMNNVVAVGQGNLAKSHIEGMRLKKIKYVTISFDNDEVGPKNTENAVNLLLNESDISSYVLDPELLTPHKDPDEFVKANGRDAFEKLLNKVASGTTWLLNRLLKDATEKSAIEKMQLLDECISIAARTTHPIDETEAVSVISKEFNLKNKEIQTLLKNKREEQNIAAHKKIRFNENERYFAFIEEKTGAYGYYDKQKDTIYLGAKKDILIEILNSAGQRFPATMPVLCAEFDVRNNKRIDLEVGLLNFFAPTEYMLFGKTDDEIIPLRDFSSIELLLGNLFPQEEERELFVNWLAGILQTRKKQLTSWIIKGEQGAGKNLFLDNVLKELFGKKQAIQVSDSQLKEKYNPWLQNSFFVAFNEVSINSNSKNEVNSKVKEVITDDEISVNDKYVRQVYIENHVNCIFFSNENVPLYIEQSDRRFNVVRTGGDLNKKEWFSKDPDTFIENLKKEVPAFAQYLMNYNYDSKKAKTVFTNYEKEMMVDAEMNEFQEFVEKLKTAELSWFEENGNSKDLTNSIRLNKMLNDKRIQKDYAFNLFKSIYEDSKIKNLAAFGKKMKENGLESIRESISGNSGEKVSYYIWK